jgi:hypothetical protein
MGIEVVAAKREVVEEKWAIPGEEAEKAAGWPAWFVIRYRSGG